jgi:L-amino acid N-acyltransferase YncA
MPADAKGYSCLSATHAAVAVRLSRRSRSVQLGFREVGTYQRHGKLDGTWRDCVIVERLLGEAAV